MKMESWDKNWRHNCYPGKHCYKDFIKYTTAWLHPISKKEKKHLINRGYKYSSDVLILLPQYWVLEKNGSRIYAEKFRKLRKLTLPPNKFKTPCSSLYFFFPSSPTLCLYHDSPSPDNFWLGYIICTLNFSPYMCSSFTYYHITLASVLYIPYVVLILFYFPNLWTLLWQNVCKFHCTLAHYIFALKGWWD